MKKTYKDYLFVGIQFFFFAIYLIPTSLRIVSIPFYLNLIGAIVSLIGGVFILIALLQLNTNLSPFPSPKTNSKLIETGLFKYIRHPIYTGIILLLGGYGIYRSSLFKIGITILLYILFYYKSSYEEKLLQNRYANYSQFKKTRGRFFLKLLK